MKKLTATILTLAAFITATAQMQPTVSPDNYTYEPQTDTAFHIEGVNPLYVELINGLSELDLYTDTYGAYLMFNPLNGFTGHYTCSADPETVNPGEFAYSDGVHDGAIFQTFVAVVQNLSFNITDYNVYFVTGGYYDLDFHGDSLEVTGELHTYWGSVITIHYKGLAPQGLLDIAPVENTSADMLRTYTDGRILHLENAGTYDLLTIDGKTLYHGSNSEILLPAPGIYLVRTATETRKVLVK